jgi:cysteine desulfurase/selenocysteine lyase
MYLDHSATSFPKPQELFEEILAYQQDVGGSPGRGTHRAADRAAAIVENARRELASLFSVPDPNRIVFTSNATESLNLALRGLLREGDHVVATCVDHNAVIRPLHDLEKNRGVRVTFVPCDARGCVDPSDVKKALRPETRLVTVNHASNVTGTIQDMEAIGDLLGNIPLLADVTQTAGSVPVDVERMNIALLAFTGHKSLYGPTGIGGLYIREGLTPLPLKQGGTGTRSENPEMPSELPHRYESGTLNMLGIAGLRGGLRFLEKVSMETVRAHEKGLMDRLMEGIQRREGIRAYGPEDSGARNGTLSLRMHGWEPSETSFLLDEMFGIQTRSGLHCSPLVHRCIGTFPEGTVRVSAGWFNTLEEMDKLLDALDEIRGMRG